jgi:hypothetical protein
LWRRGRALTLAHREHLDDVIAGYGTDVDRCCDRSREHGILATRVETW